MRNLGVLCLVAILSSAAWAENWPQFRGPERTDISKEKGLLKSWPEGGPRRLWLSKEAGIGYSGFSVVGETLYTMGARNNTEYLLALSLKDGTERWAAKMGSQLGNKWGDGPRGTPTVDGDRVYALSGQGDLVCARAADGSIEWTASMSDLGGKKPGWGYTESVLVDGDKVICTPGGKKGAVAALDKKTGKVAWQSKNFTEGAQYASVIAFDHGGKHQYCQLTMNKLVGLDAASGEVLWTSDWPDGKTAVIPTPIFHDGHIFITSGYGAGCKLIKLNDDKPEDVYVNKTMSNHHGGVVLVGDHLYGFSDKGWVCMDFKTGKQVWSEKKLEKGCLTRADGMLYLQGEKSGNIVLIEASPAGWKEHSRFKLDPQTKQRSPSGGIWTHPVIADGKLYLRDQELLSCYDIKGK